MNKTYLISGLILVLLIFLSAFYFFREPGEETREDVPIVFPSTSGGDQSLPVREESVLVLDQNGGLQPVRDFITDPNTRALPDGVYVLDELQSGVGDAYQIFFDDLNHSVSVSLQSEPLHIARLRAEESLRNVLGTSDETLCSLAIRVTVPSFVSDQFSGRDLGLGFCGDSVSLE